MIQLEFERLVESLPVVVVRVRPPRCRRRVLDFLREMLARKFRQRLADVDLLVLLALAQASPRALRFTEVMNALPGVSQTGVWNALERLDDYGMVHTGGGPGKHVYEITAAGVKELHQLTK
jgi:DNA-binding PadR family transcriptional regulator